MLHTKKIHLRERPLKKLLTTETQNIFKNSLAYSIGFFFLSTFLWKRAETYKEEKMSSDGKAVEWKKKKIIETTKTYMEGDKNHNFYWRK